PRSPKSRGRLGGVPVKPVAALCVVIVGIVAVVTGISKSAPSVTVSVRDFLLAWQVGDYAGAAKLTTGNPVTVARALKNAYSQLGAEDLVISMGDISVHGSTAQAYFHASYDLGRGGRPWQYRGQFTLRRHGDSGWQVQWSPSVITPGLGPGDRLAVLTTVPGRAPLVDAAGKSLIPAWPLMEVGVVPDQVRKPEVTANALAKVTGLAAAQADEMRAQIVAAPPNSFLELFKFQPRTFSKLRAKLRGVPDLRYRRRIEPLFSSAAPVLTGTVGTEAARVLVTAGDPYRPGTTVGLTGLQQAFQSTLAGTPTTEVIVQNSAGRLVRVLQRWQGKAGTPVRTTIDGGMQQAARNALANLPFSATIVAVRAGTGQILAVAGHQAGGMPAVSPLAGRYQPGQSFTIVSTAAVFSALPHFSANTPIPCNRQSLRFGGQTFSNVPTVKLGARKFSVDFAHACSTAFPALALPLQSSSALADTAQRLGIGVAWQLPIQPAPFTGSMRAPSPGNSGERAADMIGTGTVRVSPLDMALVAGAVDSGSWHQPSLVVGESEPRQAPKGALTSNVIMQIQQLMAQTVTSGVAQGARVPGATVSGQVGSAQIFGHHRLRAIWFVGYRGDVAFAILAFSRGAAFQPAVSIAHNFAAALRVSS
ncbi:MAG TPA: penicillin-binding transpeptidase domain-containing protein, partial [Streptosporangiaceae bacterium]